MNNSNIDPRNLIRHCPLWIRLILLALVLACVALPPTIKAQDGDELHGNTAEGLNALQTYITTASSASDDTGIGGSALFNDTSGSWNTATGAAALFSNTTGNDNTATGFQALSNNTNGKNNTASGALTLIENNADNNTATGYLALEINSTGSRNTATGESALQNNTTGQFNTATGAEALINNNASDNTATGFEALFTNTSGFGNTATGFGALFFNKAGSDNTASGLQALFNNSTGNNNTASGFNALNSNTVGNNNTAEGFQALANSTGSNNIALGSNAGMNLTGGSNNIDIGNKGAAGEATTVRIGTQGTQAATYIAGIYSKGIASATGVSVKIDSTGKLGTVLSSVRYKEAIKPMDKASESVLRLRPITFRYKKEFDPDGLTQFGLVAEDVEKVCPDLVVYDEEGKPLTVRYEAVNAMLVNEFLKEHHKVQTLEATVAQQQKQIDTVAARVQQVSAPVELHAAETAVTKTDW